MLPSRKHLAASMRASRSCEAKHQSQKKQMLKGPMTPEGTWLSKGRKLLSENFSAPTECWRRPHSDRKGNWEPVYLPLIILKSGIKRKLSKNPGRDFKEKLPKGAQRVYPDADCVRAHQRRAYALLYIREALSFMHVLCDDAYVRTIDHILNLLPEVFRVNSNFSREYLSMRKQLYILKRLKLRSNSWSATTEGSSNRAPHH